MVCKFFGDLLPEIQAFQGAVNSVLRLLPVLDAFVFNINAVNSHTGGYLRALLWDATTRIYTAVATAHSSATVAAKCRYFERRNLVNIQRGNYNLSNLGGRL